MFAHSASNILCIGVVYTSAIYSVKRVLTKLRIFRVLLLVFVGLSLCSCLGLSSMRGAKKHATFELWRLTSPVDCVPSYNEMQK